MQLRARSADDHNVVRFSVLTRCAIGMIALWACQVRNPAYDVTDSQDADVSEPDARTLPHDATPDTADVGVLLPDAAPDVAAEAGPAEGDPRLATGLVAFWRFDDATDVTAPDSSGNGNHATAYGFVGSPWVPGRNGGLAADFTAPGNQQRVEAPASSSFNAIEEAFSIAAWIYSTAEPIGWRMILSRHVAGTQWEHYALTFFEDGLAVLLTGPTPENNRSLWTDYLPPPATWTHVVGTYLRGKALLYINGHLVAEGDASGTVAGVDEPVVIGNNKNRDSYDEQFQGRLDDVMLYRRVLSAEEVAALARGALPKAP